MAQERLSALLLLCVHQDMHVDADEVVDVFTINIQSFGSPRPKCCLRYCWPRHPSPASWGVVWPRWIGFGVVPVFPYKQIPGCRIPWRHIRLHPSPTWCPTGFCLGSSAIHPVNCWRCVDCCSTRCRSSFIRWWYTALRRLLINWRIHISSSAPTLHRKSRQVDVIQLAEIECR